MQSTSKLTELNHYGLWWPSKMDLTSYHIHGGTKFSKIHSKRLKFGSEAKNSGHLGVKILICDEG